MIGVPTITQQELVERIRVNLESKPSISRYFHFSIEPAPTQSAAYVLIVGAGFSYNVVPLVDELMSETIGDYYYPDQDQWGKRPESVSRRDSARFWAEFNEAAAKEELPLVELDRKGLPKNAGAAYQYLFTFEGANALFTQLEPERPSYVEQLRQSMGRPSEKKRDAQRGKRFVKGFLRYVLDPGCEHGHGSTGRSQLNPAHMYLAKLLEAQQLGRIGAFCRTIITTNFDTLLQNALQRVNLMYRLTDKPEKGLHRSDLDAEEGPIHLVYAHGSILCHNPASTIAELSALEYENSEVFRHYLELRDVLIIGYGGWNDVLMAALRRCAPSQRNVYWCGVHSQPPPHVETFLQERAGSAVYVHLGETGADGFMCALYQALIPTESR
jgi:hypothetical protein